MSAGENVVGASAPGKGRARLDIGESGRGQAAGFPRALPHQLRAHLVEIQLQEGTGVEVQRQRRSSMTVSEIGLPRIR